MARHRVDIGWHREGDLAVAGVKIDGIGKEEVCVEMTEKDAGRMATLISLERLLTLGARFVPPPVKAGLWAVQKILAAKHKAILTGKKTSPELVNVLATAKTSPSRAIRAAAAAAEELLK